MIGRSRTLGGRLGADEESKTAFPKVAYYFTRLALYGVTYIYLGDSIPIFTDITEDFNLEHVHLFAVFLPRPDHVSLFHKHPIPT